MQAQIGDRPEQAKLVGPLASLDTESPERTRISLDASEVQLIEQALAGFKALQVEGQAISKDNFLLPAAIQAKLQSAALEVHRGCGIATVRGLDPARFSDSDNLLLFLGIANFIGDKHGIQDRKGNVIEWDVPYAARHGVHTNQSLAWHCDMGADVLAIQVRQIAAKGGDTAVASSWKVYNDLVTERPDVVNTLAKPNWPVHVSDGKTRHVLAPLVAFEGDKLLVSFDPSRLGAHPAMKPGRAGRKPVPELDSTQKDALAVLSAYAERHAVPLDTKAGDLVFINNWAVMHARSAYEDAGKDATEAGSVAARRHLLRLWLRSSELGWAIPESMRAPWESAFGYTDEGYISADADQVAAQLKYAVVPASSYKPARYTSGSAAFIIEGSDSESDEE